MKILSTFFLLILATGIASAQNHQWQWAKTGQIPNNANSDATAEAVTTDAQGNVYTTGYFWSDSITFGSYTLHNTVTGENSNDVYLVKYDPSGNVLWATSTHGPWRDYVSAIATDPAGNVYIGGSFYSDSLKAGSYTIYNQGPVDTLDDIYIVKYNSSGTVLWARDFGGDYFDGLAALTADGSGGLYFGGFFRSDSIAFDAYVLHDASARRYDNAYLTRCDSSGNVIWSVASSSSDYVQITGICTDPSGSVFATGRYTGANASFGSQVVNNSSTGWDEIFLVKYTSAGSVTWVQSAGGVLNDIAYSVASDRYGNAYLTGNFGSTTAYFGSMQADNDTSNGSVDVFVAKYDPNGNILWLNSAGGDQNDGGNSIAVDTSGNVYLTGYFYSPQVVFGSNTNTISNSVSTGASDDAFIAEYDMNGNFKSATPVGGISYESSYNISVDKSSNAYIAGFFRSDAVVFGTTTLDNSTTTHNTNPFVAKYASVPSGITELPQIPVMLYPNPANDKVVVQSQSFSSGGISAIVYDIAGAIVPVSNVWAGDKLTLDTQSLQPGIYTIMILTGGKEARARFIKVN